MKSAVVAVAIFLTLLMPSRARSASNAASFEDQLAARGLIGGAVGDFRMPERIPRPAEGVSVSEIVANLASNGQEAAHATIWQESIAGHPTEFMVTHAPGGQTMAQFWVMREGGGCELYQSAVYSKDSRLVTLDFWRNDPQSMKMPGSPEFPDDLFPNNALPIGAFFDSVNAGLEGATGKVDVDAGPSISSSLIPGPRALRKSTRPRGASIPSKSSCGRMSTAR